MRTLRGFEPYAGDWRVIVNERGDVVADVRGDKDDAAILSAAVDTARELRHLVRLLEPLEKSGAMDVPGLATLNGARAALKKAGLL